MSVFKGDCNACGRVNVELFFDGQCVICKRLDNIEKNITKLINSKKEKK